MRKRRPGGSGLQTTQPNRSESPSYKITPSVPDAPVSGAAPAPSGDAPTAGRRSRRRSSFGGDVLRLASGTTLAQAITVLSSPLLTRFYNPEAFGLWALFGSITTIIGVIVCLRYELAIMLPDLEEDAANLLGASIVSATAIALATVPIVLFGGGAIARLLRAPGLVSLLWFLPPIVLVNGVFLALNYWNSRTGHFGRLSGTRIASSATSTTVQLAGGFAHRGTAGTLVTSTLVGGTLGASLLGWSILRDDGPFFRRNVTARAIREGFRRHRKFPLYGTTSALLNSVSWQLPTFLLQHYFSASVVGLYAFGNQLLRVPMNLIGGAISQVFYQRAADAHRAGTLDDLVETTYRRLALASFVPLAVLGVVARDLFTVAFGTRWAEAGTYTQILSAWTFFWFLSSPLSTVFSILEKQEFGFKLNVVILATRFVSLAAGGIMGSARLALLFFSASGILVYGYYCFAVLSASGVPLRRALRVLFSVIRDAAPACLVLVIVKALGASPVVAVAVAAVVVAAYGYLVVKRDPALIAFLRIGGPKV